jgi:hypothetical protein
MTTTTASVRAENKATITAISTWTLSPEWCTGVSHDNLFSDGSYYYQNTDGSTYYNTGDGYARYTSSEGQVYEKFSSKK